MLVSFLPEDIFLIWPIPLASISLPLSFDFDLSVMLLWGDQVQGNTLTLQILLAL